MGRTRVKTKKASAAQTASSTSRQTPAIPDLLAKAQQLVTQYDCGLAEKFVQRILEQSPNHAEAKELLGIIQLESGELDDARETFKSLIPPAPGAPIPAPPSAHLYLAQLSDEDPHLALKHYESAVELLVAQLKGKDRAVDGTSEEFEADIRKNIVRVLIAMVEIWMAPTYDLCFDPNAEATCEKLLDHAFETGPDNVEALIALSSFRLSQQRPDDAKAAAIKAWSAWKAAEEDDPSIPPIQTRIELTKRFIELEEYPVALQVLQGIMASDDQEVEAWYLEGWCFYLMAEQAKEKREKIEELTWQELARDARDCLEQCRTLHVAQKYPDARLAEHVSELISQLDLMGIKPVLEGEDSDDAADGWEDVSDSDGDVEMQ